MALAAVFKAVVMLLLIRCSMYHRWCLGALCLVFVLVCTTLCPFLFCNHLDEEEKVDCFTVLSS